MTIETKFAPGDEAWMLFDNKVCHGVVSSVTARLEMDGMFQSTKTTIECKVGEQVMNESILFPTKAALLESL